MTKNEMRLIKLTVNKDIKNKLLTELASLNRVHIREKKEDDTEKSSKEQEIKDLKKKYDKLLKKINLSETSISDLEIKEKDKLTFKIKDLYELASYLRDEIEFYLNRINELNRFIHKTEMELNSAKRSKKYYLFLDKFGINQQYLNSLNILELGLYTTFSKNIPLLVNLFRFSKIPNVYHTQKISPDRDIFFTVYPKNRESDIKERIKIIHGEEVKIMNKYLTKKGVNHQRIEKEIDSISQNLDKYREEIKNFKKEKLATFAAINEAISNLSMYFHAENQFKTISTNYSELEFFVPDEYFQEVKEKMKESLGEEISMYDILVKKRKKIKKKSISRQSHESDSTGKNLKEVDSEFQEKENKKNQKTKEKENSSENNTTQRKKDHGEYNKENENTDEEGEFITAEEFSEDKEQIKKSTPTRMQNNKVFRPYETLVRMYGVPNYSEIDPTKVLFFTFPFLFGIMFGDIGHGIVLMVSGLIGTQIFSNKNDSKNFSWIIFYCGIGALIFGILYGEFFGLQQIPYTDIELGLNIYLPWMTEPFHLKHPLENVMSVFFFAIMVGVININLGWIIKFLNYLKNLKIYKAFTEPLIKIWFLDGGVWLILTYGLSIGDWMAPPYPILIVLIPIILLFIFKPLGKLIGFGKAETKSYGELISEGSIDTIEMVLSVPSNILSYVRLLALALAHIALLVTVKAMIGIIPTGLFISQILIIAGLVVGNALVILLEGVIVFLNDLRLHFYEFFFKFYGGSGVEYKPFVIKDNFSNIKFEKVEEQDLVSKKIEEELGTKLEKELVKDAKKHFSEEYS